MSALDPALLETLSDSDAVSLLFELTGNGQDSGDRLLRLDAVVYRRLLQAYDGDDSPVIRHGVG